MQIYIRAIVQSILILAILGLCISSGIYLLLAITKILVRKMHVKNEERWLTHYLYEKIFNEEVYRSVYVFVLSIAFVFFILFILAAIILGVGYIFKLF